MNAIARRLWINDIQRVVYQCFTILMLQNIAICQAWLKKRHAIRQRCFINAEIFNDYGAYSAVIRDISLQGARLECRHNFKVGERLAMNFSLHYLESPVEVGATVVWTRGEQMGLRFDNA